MNQFAKQKINTECLNHVTRRFYR